MTSLRDRLREWWPCQDGKRQLLRLKDRDRESELEMRARLKVAYPRRVPGAWNWFVVYRGVPYLAPSFEDAKAVAGGAPAEILTDGMPTYPAAIKKEFGRYRLTSDDPVDWKVSSHAHYTPHRVVPSIRAPESNNLVERLHGSEKGRIRPMRGFDTMDGTAALMEGYRVHYNLVRPHLALGRTPGEAAGLPSISGFRWREIIRLAAAPEVREAKEVGNENGETPANRTEPRPTVLLLFGRFKVASEGRFISAGRPP